MAQKAPDCFLVDIDGVIRKERQVLSGVPEFFRSMTRLGIAHPLSNNSRKTSAQLLDDIRNMGVETSEQIRALTSADATAKWMKENPLAEDKARIYAIGEQGLFDALRLAGIPAQNEELWNGTRWNVFPTDVVVGFDTGVDYEKLAPAYNAVNQRGSRLIGTNPDLEYRDANGNIFPANGAALNYLDPMQKYRTVIGKPGTGMPEVALSDMGAQKESAHIAVIGDTLEQDMAMANALREAGWNVQRWLVLSGLEDSNSILGKHGSYDRVFADIREITSHLNQL